MRRPLELVDSEPIAARSQASSAYRQIRADILAGRHAPGERLKILDLARALEVSPGAVREALSRLAPQQLVVAQDQKGFVVAPLSIEDLLDLTEVRCEIESAALRRAVARGDDAWEAAVLTTAYRLSRTSPGDDPHAAPSADWVDRHAQFHASLVGACGSRRLLELHGQLYEQSERYRGLSTRSELSRDVPAEHQALVDAALARDADALVGLMVDHIRATTALIVGAARDAAAG